MSRQNIENDLRKYAGADKALDTALRREVSTRAFTHEVTISVTKLKHSFIRALQLVDDTDYQNAIAKWNIDKRWVTAINSVMRKATVNLAGRLNVGKKWGQPRILAAGRVKITGGGKTGKYKLLMFSHKSGGSITHIADVLTYLKDSIYEEWRSTNKVGEKLEHLKNQQGWWKRVTGADPEGWGKGGAQKKYRDEIQFSHAKESTAATSIISKAVKDALTQPTYGSDAGVIVTEDLIYHLWKELKIDWFEETYINDKGVTVTERVVRGVLHDDHRIWPTDKGEIKWDKLIKIINEWFADKSKYLSGKEAIDFEASPSFKEQARAAAQYALLRQLMEKNKKYVAVKKIKTKKPKYGRKKRSGTVQSRAKGKTSTTSFVVAARRASKISKGAEKGTGAEASTSQAADLARLRQYINRRLPAEVRRNMGRPALINRTGRFSNSVQLLSLTQAQSTAMAKYTYLLNPYQTFENTGRTRWPMAYNPKPLIAKSIRNLAQGRIEQKLTVRRV